MFSFSTEKLVSFSFILFSSRGSRRVILNFIFIYIFFFSFSVCLFLIYKNKRATCVCRAGRLLFISAPELFVPLKTKRKNSRRGVFGFLSLRSQLFSSIEFFLISLKKKRKKKSILLGYPHEISIDSSSMP